ncbi:MAG: transglutaminase-like domain-containing protein [Phycisphaerales bacterium]|nr:transglutaminase-like domain-containing protein [Phycisphaerales bacterium]
MRRVLLLLCACCLTSVAAGEAVEAWYEMELLGQPGGWSHSLEQSREGEVQYSSETAMRIRRGAIEVSIRMQSDWVETTAGVPITMTMRQDMSGQRMTTLWTFKGDTIEVTGSQGGRRTSSTVAAPKESWYPAGALQRETARRVVAGEEEFSLRTMLPDIGVKIVTVTSTRTGSEDYELDGKTIPVTIWKVSNDAMPFGSVVKLNAKGEIVENITDAPFGKIIMRRTTKSKALAALEGSDVPELMESLMVPVDRPIAGWRTDRTAVFRLKARQGEVPELPSSGYQRVGPVADDGTVELRVDLDAPSVASEADRTSAALLGTSTMIDPTDPAVIELKDKALVGVGASAADRAEALRAKVHEWITRKDYATVYATASETARTRTGDCTEHGVLLAALLRADGIPARVASGAVYLPPGAVSEGPVFGWHMWTQAIIDGHWVDLDATLPVPYSVGHLLADTSAMTDSEGMSDQMNLLALIGNLSVDVLSIDGSPDS